MCFIILTCYSTKNNTVNEQQAMNCKDHQSQIGKQFVRAKKEEWLKTAMRAIHFFKHVQMENVKLFTCHISVALS